MVFDKLAPSGAAVIASDAIVADPGAAGSLKYNNDDLGLSFYDKAPTDHVALREIEEFAAARLRLLHAIDQACGYESMLLTMQPVKQKLIKVLTESRLELTVPSDEKHVTGFLADKMDFVKRDFLSHFILRLSFCSNRESRDWFVKQEQRLFVLRFETLSKEAQEQFLLKAGVDFKKLNPLPPKDSDEQKFIQYLQKRTPGARIFGEAGTPPTFETNFYAMPFFKCPASLISSRRVVLKAGIAYLPKDSMKSLLTMTFKERLNAGLDAAFQGLPAILMDPRVGPFVRYIQDHGPELLFLGSKSGSDEVGEKLTLANFEKLMENSFAPCMRRMIEKQRDTKKHLKHAGRLQLRPFLKDCGFSMEESIRWWKEEICKDAEIDTTMFEKNYMYDLEHTYGKKGHLQGSHTMGCPKIIGFPNEAVGQTHGCCFKHLDIQSLKMQLHKWRLPESSVGEIEKLVSGHHYQLGCIEYFKAKHAGSEGDAVGNSPNDYFKESCAFHKKRAEKEAALKATPAAIENAATPAVILPLANTASS